MFIFTIYWQIAHQCSLLNRVVIQPNLGQLAHAVKSIYWSFILLQVVDKISQHHLLIYPRFLRKIGRRPSRQKERAEKIIKKNKLLSKIFKENREKTQQTKRKSRKYNKYRRSTNHNRRILWSVICQWIRQPK